jgi:hypothetical protein
VPAVVLPAKVGVTVPVPTNSVTVLPEIVNCVTCPLTGLVGIFTVCVYPVLLAINMLVEIVALKFDVAALAVMFA